MTLARCLRASPAVYAAARRAVTESSTPTRIAEGPSVPSSNSPCSTGKVYGSLTPAPRYWRNSAGTVNASSRASPGAVSAHGPVRPRTATAAVGNACGGAVVRARQALGQPGQARVVPDDHRGAPRVVDTRGQASAGQAPSPRRPGARSGSRGRGFAQERPPPAPWPPVPRSARARCAVEQITASGTYPDAPSQRPTAGASRLPRLASGRSWSATSGQSDFACRSRTSLLPASSVPITPP